MKKYILFAIVTYLFGFFIAINFELDIAKNIENSTEQSISSITELMKMDKTTLLMKIIKNNFFVLFLNIFGCFSLGGITFINTLYNGFIIGLFIKTISIDFKTSEILYHLLPHSLELVAIVLSCSIGYKFSLKVYKSVFNESKTKIEKQEINLILLSAFFIVFSAFMETYVSTTN